MSFTMLTTSSGKDVAPYHDRQIAVLPARNWGDWLYLDRPVHTLLQPCMAGTLNITLARQGNDPIAPVLLERAG